MQWFHACIGVDLTLGLVSAMVDGFAMPETAVDGLADERPYTLAGRLVLDWWYHVRWAMTNVQVFGRKLTLEEMRSLTVGGGCGGGLEGDYLAWRHMQWNATSNNWGQLVWRGITREELCSSNRPVRFVNTGWATHGQAVGFCSRIQNSHIPGTG